MSGNKNPGTVHVRLIWEDSTGLLKSKGDQRLHPDQKIMLAALLFADGEGIAKMGPEQLQRYCADRGPKASRAFVQGRIDHLIQCGVLAPGSTLTELRSMFGRSAYGEVAEEAATDQTVADTGLTEHELRAWFAGWEEAYFLRSGASEETRGMVASTRAEATMEQIVDLWEQTRLEAA